MNPLSPSALPLISKSEDLSKSLSPKQRSFPIILKKNFGENNQIDSLMTLMHKKTGKTQIDTDPNIDESFKIGLSGSGFGLNIKIKRFINRLKQIANLNTSSPGQALFINDLAFFNATLSNDATQKSKKGLKNYFFLRNAFYLAVCLQRILFKIFKNFQFEPFHPFELKKISWDIFLFLNTLILFFYVPLTFSFNVLQPDIRDAFQKLQFAIYVIDMLINMNTAYIDNGVLIKERWKSFSNYWQTFFIWDLLTVISVAQKNDFLSNDNDYGVMNPFVFVQLLFFAKFKMFQVRFNNIKEIFCLDIKLKGVLDLSVLFVTTFLFSHFLGCVFHFLAINTTFSKNWVSYYSFDYLSALDQYLYSLYWATVTMMTVGYGDIVPQNPLEITFTVFTIFVGCIVVGYNINKIGNIFHDMNKETMKIQENLNKINKFMDSKRINGNLQMRIRAYLKFVWEKKNEKMNTELQNIIDCLSEPLKEELYLEGYGDVLRRYNLFSNNFCSEFLSCLIKHMEEQTFMKNDLIFEEHDTSKHNLYFIKSGEIELFRLLDESQTPIIFKKLKNKDSFGEYAFFTGLKNTFSARACTYTQVYKISREKFIEAVAKYPKDYERYCELRDKLILYQDYQNFNIRCIICSRKSHLNDNCNLMHFVPNKEVIILRYLYSAPQERRKFERRKHKECNSLNDKLKIRNKFIVFNSRLRHVNNVSESSDSDSESSIEIEARMSISNELVSEKNDDKLKKTLNHTHTLKKLTPPFINPTEKSLDVIERKTLVTFNNDNEFQGSEVKIASQNNIHNPNPKITSRASLPSTQRLSVKDRKQSNQTPVPLEIDMDLVHYFAHYFPDENVEKFIEKYDKIKITKKKSSKKKDKFKSEENSPRKKGFALFEKSVGFEKKIDTSKEKGYHSENDKNRKKSSFFGSLRLSPSYSFFKKKENKATCLFEVVNEVTEQKVKKSSSKKMENIH